MGRRLMARSKPPVTIKLDKKAMDEANKIDEELAYFFTLNKCYYNFIKIYKKKNLFL